MYFYVNYETFLTSNQWVMRNRYLLMKEEVNKYILINQKHFCVETLCVCVSFLGKVFSFVTQSAVLFASQ